MNSKFNIWKTNRSHFLEALNTLSNEQLNKVPEGFSNNIIWNVDHILVIQQVLIYKRSGLEMNISDELYQIYKSGSKPERIITAAEVEELKVLLESTMNTTKADLLAEKFQSYQELTTSTRFHIDSFETALQFNNYHEGLHLGYVFCLKKFV